MKSNILVSLLLLLLAGPLGCANAERYAKWGVFYDAEKGPEKISIPYEPQPLNFYTNRIPTWNYDFREPAPVKINSFEIKTLGEVGGLRVIEMRLSVSDDYYTDGLMLLQEVAPDKFLPVYVQDYAREIRWPTASTASQSGERLVVSTGMDYAGSGSHRNQYKITFSPNHRPAITASFTHW